LLIVAAMIAIDMTAAVGNGADVEVWMNSATATRGPDAPPQSAHLRSRHLEAPCGLIVAVEIAVADRRRRDAAGRQCRTTDGDATSGSSSRAALTASGP